MTQKQIAPKLWRHHLIAAGIVSLVAAMLAANTSCERGGATEATQAVTDVPTVAVVKATRTDLSSDLVLTAEFAPYQEIDVMAKVSGYIRQINVDIGSRVQEGQLLATLEIHEMQ